MKEITIEYGIFMSSVTLKKDSEKAIDVYCFGEFVGFMKTDTHRLRHEITTDGKKHYTIERRKHENQRA